MKENDFTSYDDPSNLRRSPYFHSRRLEVGVAAFYGVVLFLIIMPVLQPRQGCGPGWKGYTISRAEPVIAAIKKYTARHGKPPSDLRSLVPRYLPELPKPNRSRWEAWRYTKTANAGVGGWELQIRESAQHSESRQKARGWVQQIHTLAAQSAGGQKFMEVLVYHPSERYKEKDYPGSLQRIEGWGYYYEL